MPENDFYTILKDVIQHPMTYVSAVVGATGLGATVYRLTKKTQTTGAAESAKKAAHEAEEKKHEVIAAKHEADKNWMDLYRELQQQMHTMNAEFTQERKKHYAEIDSLRTKLQEEVDTLRAEIQELEKNKAQIEQYNLLLRQDLEREQQKTQTLETELERRETEIEKYQHELQKSREGYSFYWKGKEKSNKNAPLVEADETTNSLRITGNSQLSGNAAVDTFEFLSDVAKSIIGRGGITILIDLQFLSSSTQKQINVLLDVLEAAHKQGKKVEMTWLYNEDEDMKETAEEILDGFTFPRFIQTTL